MNREEIADLSVVVIAACALAVTGMAVHRQYFASSTTATREVDHQVEDWQAYLDGGHRLGPQDAAVTIVEFGDYECPFCRRFETALRAVRAEYPEDLAVVYRHLPLSMHPDAYLAARFTECAAAQDRFAIAHEQMYDLDELGSLDASQFAEDAGVRDKDAFVACAEGEEPVPEVEKDRDAARELGVTSTPTVVINGLRIARTPDRDRLIDLVEDALSGRIG